MKRIAIAVLFSAAVALCGAHSGAQGLLPELDLSSPAGSMRTFTMERQRIEHLYAEYQKVPTIGHAIPLGQTMLRLGTRIFDLSDLSPATRAKTAAFSIGYLADIMDRLPVTQPDSIPGATDEAASALPARWTIPGTEIRLVRLDGGPHAGDYVFSTETLAQLPKFHAQIAGLPALRPSGIGYWHAAQLSLVGPLLAGFPFADMPAPLQTPLLGTPLFKVLLASLVILVIVAAVLGWAALVRRWANAASPWRRRALWITVPGLLALLTIVGHEFNVWQVNLAIELADAETILATIVLYAATAWAAYGACWLLAETIIVSPIFPDDTYDAHLIRIAARVASLLAVGGIIIYGANDVGVPLVGLVAGVSVGGIALALAAQSTVENLFGSVTIFADRPFRVGDTISYGGSAGTVEVIGPRSTRIRGADGTLTTVPNGDLAKAQVTNLSARTKTLFQNRIALPGGVPSRQVERVLADLRQRVVTHPLVEKVPGMPRVRLVAFDAATIAIETTANVLTTANAEFLEVQEALILEIMRGIETCGIELAMPVPAA